MGSGPFTPAPPHPTSPHPRPARPIPSVSPRSPPSFAPQVLTSIQVVGYMAGLNPPRPRLIPTPPPSPAGRDLHSGCGVHGQPRGVRMVQPDQADADRQRRRAGSSQGAPIGGMREGAASGQGGAAVKGGGQGALTLISCVREMASAKRGGVGWGGGRGRGQGA